MLRLRLISLVGRLASLAPLSLAACGTLIGLGDLERADCSDACGGRAEPRASTSGSGWGEHVGGRTQTPLGGAQGVAGTAAPSSGAGGTTNGGTTGGTNDIPDVNGGADTATEGSSGGASDVGGGGRGGGGVGGVGGQAPSAGGGTANLPIRINFQPLGAAVPRGYVPDTGLTFAAQDGLSFGWNAAHTDVTRDRGINSNQLLDTLCHFHEGAVWELALPNGTYNVLASVGDPMLPSTYTLIVEGVTYWQGRAISANHFLSNTASITIADGRLTLSQGSASELATRINFVEVSAP